MLLLLLSGHVILLLSGQVIFDAEWACEPAISATERRVRYPSLLGERMCYALYVILRLHVNYEVHIFEKSLFTCPYYGKLCDVYVWCRCNYDGMSCVVTDMEH